MHSTLPTLDELRDMELTAYKLYRAEIQRLPREASTSLIDRARLGEPEAREQIVLACQNYALLRAVQIYLERRPGHIEVLDLVGAANLAIVESLDLALSKTNPVAYLMRVAVQTISRECIYHAPLIQKPRVALEQLKRYQWYEVVSLDTPVYRDNDDDLLVDSLCASPTPLLDEEKLTHRFAPLYEAIKALPRAQRATIIRTYGFFGQPAETTGEIHQTAPHNVVNNAWRARRNLRRMLEAYLDRMVCPRPEEEASR